MGRIFVVRSKPNGQDKEEDFIDGTLSVGWSEIGDLSGKSKEDIKEDFNRKWDRAGRTELTQLYNFITIPIGSIVLTPSIMAPEVHIFETTSGYTYVKERDDASGDGNPHQLSCKLLKTVQRGEFSDIVQRAFNASRRAVTNFSKYYPEIEGFLDGQEVSNNRSTDKYSDAAKDALMSLLNSEDEEIKYKAALALLKKSE